jgi:hypothetical protein
MEEEKYSLEEYAMSIKIPAVSLEDAAFTAIGTQLGSAIDASTLQMKTSNRIINPSMATVDRWDGSINATIKSNGKPVEIRPFEVNPDMSMLEDASSPYNIDPETLSNLWAVRFGKGWVGSEAVEDMDAEENNWWRHAANRLRELGYLEMHTLASSYRVVLRIVE